MDCLADQRFTFQALKLPPDTFGVVNFSGKEGLSTCYGFDVLLVSDRGDLEITEVLQSPVKLSLLREGGPAADYAGVPLFCEQLHAVDGYLFYRTRIVPRLFWLSLTHHHQVFLDKTIPEIVAACCRDAGLTDLDFELRLQKSYESREYVCQYGESHLNFISRWCEREGIYYFFEQTAAGEKVVFTDTRIAHAALPQGEALSYRALSGLERRPAAETVSAFHRRCHLVPATVLLKDYNYLRPSLEISGTAAVDDKGRGRLYRYGDHFPTREEGNRLAAIQAEALRCRRETFHGESTVPYLSPGFTFTLRDHFQSAWNRSYLTTEVSHEGSQTGYLISGLRSSLAGGEQQVSYKNTFTAIPAEVQFRPERRAERPRISGTLSARIDAAGSGQYAEIDEHGRYKVILPFDTSGRKDGTASARIRMAQPYGGGVAGMHFPLRKGAEVLLTFLDRDPDRPIITGAVPNPETPSPVRDANQTQAIFRSGSHNKIAVEDQAGKEQIHLQTPNRGSSLTVGAGSDRWRYFNPADIDKIKEGFDKYVEWMKETFGEYETMEKSEDVWGIELFTNKLLTVSAEAANKVILGEETTFVGGGVNDFIAGWEWCIVMGLYLHWVFGGILEVHLPEKMKLENFHATVNTEHLETHVKNLEATVATKTELADEIRSVGRRHYDLLMKRLQVIDSKFAAVNEQVAAVNRDVRAHNDDLRAINNQLSAHTSSIRACADEIKSIGTAIQDTGMAIATLGVIVEEGGTATSSIGTEIKDMGLSVNSAGIHATDAPLISQN